MKIKSDISRVSAMYRRNASITSAVASALFQSVDSNIGRKAVQLLCEKQLLDLVGMKLNPNEYQDPYSFRDDYLVSSLLSKFSNFDLKVDRASLAIEKFLESEKQCSTSNKRIGMFVSSIKSPYTVESVIWLAQLKIRSLLGPFSWDEAEQYFGFGPGSTTSLPRRRGDAYFKFGAVRPHVTKGCSDLAITAVRRVPRWFSHLASLAGEDLVTLETLPNDQLVKRLFTIVPGNRVTTVPKSAKIDRVIAIEPDLNMYIQKGLGGIIRDRLRRVGIDLNNQCRNQDLARDGSLNGTLATLDLSSASDTVSMRCVEVLLPDDWVTAIKQCRSPRGTLPDGSVLTYQKVSSMGNGFTFELESLVFWAICSSVISIFRPREDRLAVYGDDIIISSEVYGTTVWLLDYFGFTVNADKSFCSGPFRESCGKHFFKGVDVSPFYIREDIVTPDRIIWFCNSLRRWVRLPIYGLDGRFKYAYDLASVNLPKVLQKPSIPDGLGDIALMGDFDEARPPRSKHLQCYEAVGVSDIRETFVPGEVPYLLRSLSSLEKKRSEAPGDSSSGVILRHKTRWKSVRIPTTQWESYGPWLGS